MTKHKIDQDSGLPEAENTVRANSHQNSAGFIGWLEHPIAALAAAGIAAFLWALFPAGWLAAPACVAFAFWRQGRKFRLPFRLPMGWRGPDFSNPGARAIKAVPSGSGPAASRQ